MSTSVYTPYADPTGVGQGWILNRVPGDSESLGWALESSRYDLYNGAWAAAAAAGNVIDYAAVKQGSNEADGALMWRDLSTGLKPRTALIMTGLTSPLALPGQIWMLSNQCGPFVNDLGVRFSKRGSTTPVTPADLLTFTCPDADLPTTTALAGTQAHWPGWSGMAGQWYGPGTASNANVPVVWSLDQYSLAGNGVTDPDNGVVPPTESTEDNFGVFADFGIQVAAWLAMAQDLQNGISQAALKYTSATGVPNLGCYELGFMPMSWFGPIPTPPAYTPL